MKRVWLDTEGPGLDCLAEMDGQLILDDQDSFNAAVLDIDELSAMIDAWSSDKGWNDAPDHRDVLLNMHGEISETQEHLRDGRNWTDIYYVEKKDGLKPDGPAIEVADMIIRGLHWLARQGHKPSRLIALKMTYNEGRPHRHGGKTA